MKKNSILFVCVVAVLSAIALNKHWMKEREKQIINAINIRVPADEPSDANIQQAIDQVVMLYDLNEETREYLYTQYYVGGSHE